MGSVLTPATVTTDLPRLPRESLQLLVGAAHIRPSHTLFKHQFKPIILHVFRILNFQNLTQGPTIQRHCVSHLRKLFSVSFLQVLLSSQPVFKLTRKYWLEKTSSLWLSFYCPFFLILHLNLSNFLVKTC